MSQSKGEMKRERLLAVLVDKGGSATTAELKEATGWKGNLIGHHMRTLRSDINTGVDDVESDHPQVVVDRKEAMEGQQLDMNVYRITDVGRERLEKSDVPPADLLDNRTTKELRRDLRELESDFDDFREGYNELVSRLQNNGVI